MEKIMVDAEARYPGVDVAYDLVQPSYEWMMERLRAAHERIGKLGALAATITLGVLAVTVNAEIAYPSLWLWSGLVFFAFTIALGAIGAYQGALKLPAITDIGKEHLHKGRWELRKDLILWAGEDFKDNWSAVQTTARWLLAMTVALGLEVTCLLIWLLLLF